MADELSILNSIKKLLGIDPEYDVYDDEITIHINSVFSILHQIGASPTEGFMLVTGDEVWSQFLQNAQHVQMVKTYVYLRVRLIFDPPATAFALTAFEKQASELEWRLSIMELEFNPDAYGPSGIETIAYVLPVIEPMPEDAPSGAIAIDPVTGAVWQDVP